MKHNDLNDISYKITPQHYENIFNVYEDSDIGYFYNLLRTVNFPSDLNPSVYNVYVIKPKDTWPLISWKTYGTIYLWWSICSLNNINNPINIPEPGTEIKILKPLYLRTLLSDLQNQ